MFSDSRVSRQLQSVCDHTDFELSDLNALRISNAFILDTELPQSIPNVKSLHLNSVNFLPHLSINKRLFESIVTLSLNNIKDIARIKELFPWPQIKNVSLHYKELKWLVDHNGLLETFSSLENIEFYNIGPDHVNLVIEALSRMPSSITRIRFRLSFLYSNDWKLLQPSLCASIGLKSIHFPRRQHAVNPFTSNSRVLRRVAYNIEESGIKIKTCDEEKDFESWLGMIGEFD